MELLGPQHRAETRIDRFNAFAARIGSITDIVVYVEDDDGPANMHPEERVHLTEGTLAAIKNAAEAQSQTPAIIDPDAVKAKIEEALYTLGQS
jgi:hypothetical protein